MPQMERPSQYIVSFSSIDNMQLQLVTGVSDPATNEALGTVADMGAAETKSAIEAADTAFKTWSKTAAKVCLFLSHD